MDRLTSEASAPAKPFGLEWGAGVAALLLAGCGSGAGTDPASARRDDTGAAVAADPIPADATGTPDAHETPSSSEKPVPPKRVDATSAATPSPPNDGDYGDDFWNLGAGSRTQLGFSLDPRMASGTALFLCDALARPVVLALTVPDALGEARLVTIPKTNRPQSARIVTVEMPDPGAGNIHYPLTVEGRTIGDVHAVNWGIPARQHRADRPVRHGGRHDARVPLGAEHARTGRDAAAHGADHGAAQAGSAALSHLQRRRLASRPDRRIRPSRARRRRSI